MQILIRISSDFLFIIQLVRIFFSLFFATMDRNVYLTRINGLKDVCLVAEDDGFPVNWDVFTVLVDDNGFDVCEGLSDTDQQFMNRLSALINHLNAILGHTLLPIPGINFLKSVNNILRYLITHIKIIYDIHFEVHSLYMILFRGYLLHYSIQF